MENEPAAFSFLTKPPDRLSAKDNEKVKMVSSSLLRTLREEELVLDWKET